jgi:hypothetical protein
MDPTPPTPETTVSLFVWALTSLAAFTVVLVLLVVRRRGNIAATVSIGLLLLLLFAAVGVNLIVPPVLRSHDTGGVTACPYDRLIWSNMRADVDDVWQPCRRAARAQLAIMLMGGALVTVLAAGIAPRADTRGSAGREARRAALPRR